MRRRDVQPDPVDPFPDRYLDLPESPRLMTVSSFLQALKDGAVYVKKIPAQKRLLDAEKFPELKELVD